MGLVVLLGVLATFQTRRARHTLREVRRTQLAFLARLQAQSGLEELRAQVIGSANDPATRLFATLRQLLDAPFTEVDLAPVLAGPTTIVKPSWGVESRGAAGGAVGRLLEWSATLRAPRNLEDPRAGEELAALLELRVVARMADAHAFAVRELTSRYELRITRCGVPRPFDQAGLFLGELAGLVDVGRVSGLRGRWIDASERLRGRLASMPSAAWPPDLVQRAAQIRDGMPTRAELEQRTPVPPLQAALLGFHHVEVAQLADLALLPGLEAQAVEVARREADLAAASGADPEAQLEAAYQLASALSDGLDTMWGYQHALSVLPHQGDAYRHGVKPFLGRLTPDFFLARAHLRLTPDEPSFLRWTEGEGRLEGVVDLTGARESFELTGDLEGRAVLVVGRAGVTLDGVNPYAARSGDRLVVVSLGGSVEVRGRTSCDVVMLGTPESPRRTGRLTVIRDATLRGKLVVPYPRAGALELEGKLEEAPEGRASWPPSASLARSAGGGEYLVAVSPAPLFTAGRAR